MIRRSPSMRPPSSATRPLGIALLLITVGAVALPATLGAQTSSAFEPPEKNDHTFVLNDAPYLDASCATNEESPLVYSIPVNRFAGPTKEADHTLANAETLARAGLLSKTATLTIVFKQEKFNNFPVFAPQRDRLLFNGVAVGDMRTGNPPFLQGQQDHWRKNSFEVPIGMVKFPPHMGNGAPPLDELNEVQVVIDTANVPAGKDIWCTEVDWVSLSFKTMSPVILIHGNSSKGAFFAGHGFTEELTRQGLLWDNSISLVPNATSVAINASKLDGLIPFIARSFGVDSLHLVAHSKGGLDARAYLADYQRGHDKDFKVLSYTSLSTPHNGSVLADLIVAREKATTEKARVEFSGYPDVIAEVAAEVDFNDGYPDLTTAFALAFNDKNIPRLPAVPDYNVTAGDADLNGNGKIDLTPDEFEALRIDEPKLRGVYDEGFVGRRRARAAVDTAYQILLKTKGVTVIPSTETVNGQKVKVVTLTAVPRPDIGNDTLVTVPSGLGTAGFQSKTNPEHRFAFVGPDGRNHSSIADAGVAAKVISWIIAVEKTDGDLR